VGGEEGGGAKGKGTSKEWNKQQAKATQALNAEYFDIYMVKMFELKQAAGASWSKPGVHVNGHHVNSSKILAVRKRCNETHD
jgi:hypothetical protein